MTGFRAQKVELGKIIFDPDEAGTYRLYLATLEEGETDWQYVRTIGGAIYYEITISADSKMTIAETPTFVTESASGSTAIHKVRKSTSTSSSSTRYLDLQGREVNGSTKGLVIRRQGNEVKKVMNR